MLLGVLQPPSAAHDANSVWVSLGGWHQRSLSLKRAWLAARGRPRTRREPCTTRDMSPAITKTHGRRGSDPTGPLARAGAGRRAGRRRWGRYPFARDPCSGTLSRPAITRGAAYCLGNRDRRGHRQGPTQGPPRGPTSCGPRWPLSRPDLANGTSYSRTVTAR